MHPDLGLLQAAGQLWLFLQSLATKLVGALINGFPVALNIKLTPCQHACHASCCGASASEDPHFN